MMMMMKVIIIIIRVLKIRYGVWERIQPSEKKIESLVLVIKMSFPFSPTLCKVKVKCTLVQALRLCTGRTAHRGSRGIALLYRH
jgi:hypothetical protein